MVQEKKESHQERSKRWNKTDKIKFSQINVENSLEKLKENKSDKNMRTICEKCSRNFREILEKPEEIWEKLESEFEENLKKFEKYLRRIREDLDGNSQETGKKVSWKFKGNIREI